MGWSRARSICKSPAANQPTVNFLAPVPPVAATCFAFTQAEDLIGNPKAATGVRIILQPEARWQIRSAKTTQLLYAVMCKEAARAAGVDDAWLVDGGHITEATSSNAHIIDQRGVLVSHPVDHGVLPGVTRINVLALAAANGADGRGTAVHSRRTAGRA